MYFDANNLEWAMANYFPTNEFKYLTDEEIENVDICQIHFIKSLIHLEVDLQYSKKIRGLHNSYLKKCKQCETI